MRIIALYLPQFHTIPENDEWWGKDFTEWVNVKKAKPIYEGHIQPRLPLNDNYYDLTDDSVKIWQAKIAKEHGIYGFCYYHYWFNGKMLLEKPMEQMLANKEIDIPFCVSWANEPWTKAWVGDMTKVLIPQHYGEEKEWGEHFNYLLPFFKDERYMKEDGKPVFVFYRPTAIPCLDKMMAYWNGLAIKAGFPGLCFISQTDNFGDIQRRKDDPFDYHVEFQPIYAHHLMFADQFKTLKAIRRKVSKWVEDITGIDLKRYGQKAISKVTNATRVDYQKMWDIILNQKPISSKSIAGAFVRWDNTPRHGERGWVCVPQTPADFEKNLEKQILHMKKEYCTDMMFIYAWNEWAEGGYLEPDQIDGYGYLDAIKEALIRTEELPG